MQYYFLDWYYFVDWYFQIQINYYFHHQINAMEDRIKSAGEFLIGKGISIADILFMSCLDFARSYDIVLPEFLAAYQARLGARPAYVESFSQNYPGLAVDQVR